MRSDWMKTEKGGVQFREHCQAAQGWALTHWRQVALSVRFRDHSIGGLVPALGRNPPLTRP